MSTNANPFDQQKAIPGVKKIIAVSSGKGGVGKSSIAANLAVVLGQKFKVGLLDADIYGPSVPRLFGCLHQRPTIDSDQRLEPIERFGIKLMSIGFLIDEASAVVWRGPMLFKAMDQFFRDVKWGDLDFLIIDLPPGTGDIQLSLAQKLPVSGAISVCTPQNIALADVKKSVDMWSRVSVPLLGLIENQSYLLHPVTGEKIQLFPKGDLSAYADLKKIEVLGEIPFDTQLAMACEIGIPFAISHPNSLAVTNLKEIAANLAVSMGF